MLQRLFALLSLEFKIFQGTSSKQRLIPEAEKVLESGVDN
jgi:hypothetical protein